MVEEEIPPS
jgi:hypothetical protein